MINDKYEIYKDHAEASTKEDLEFWITKKNTFKY